MEIDELAEELQREIDAEGKATLRSNTVQLLLPNTRFENEEQFTDRLCGKLSCYRRKNEDGNWEFASARTYF